MSTDCLLCKFNSKNQFIDETSSWFVDEPRDFEFPGLFFIRLKRHCEALSELTEEESSEVGSLIKKYSAKSYKVSKAQRVLAMSLGLTDPHIHFWILPKTQKNGQEVELIKEAMHSILRLYK